MSAPADNDSKKRPVGRERRPPSDQLAAMRPRSEWADRLFEVSLDLLCVAHTSGYFIEVNPEFERVLGYTDDELTSRPFVDFVHPEDREDTLLALGKLGSNIDVRGFTNRYICKDGSVVWLEWQARAYEDGELVYGSARNITDLRRAELEREQMELKFREAQKLESVALLAGGIAHDFNNLLTTILGNAGLISMQVDDSDPLQNRAEAIRRAASTAADLCEQLLAYAGEGQFDVERMNLSAIVEDTDHLLEASISKTAALEYELEEELPAAELDATQIRQILMNVVKNASEALGDQSGAITVETGVTECDRSDFHDTYLNDDLEEGTYVYLTISDTGCGMNPEEIERIFDPFYSTKFDGSGLGLAATLGIVRAHEGALEVESEPDQGTSFRFLFPAVQTNQPFTDEPQEEPLPSINAQTLLVIDDEEGIVEYVEKTMESQDVAVLKATEGREALDVFEHYHEEVSVVILDTTLPKFDGAEMTERLRDVDSTVPIILSSGYSREKSSADIPDDQIAGFLRKPYGPADLLRMVGRVGS